MYNTGLAYVLWLFSGCGALGFHRFYLGKIPTGVLWMCTGGLGMIGSIYDFFTLGRQVREANYRNAIRGGGRVHYHYDRRWRDVDDGETRIIHEKDAEKKEQPERTILRLAKNSEGLITAADLALEAEIPMEEAKKQLDSLVKKGFAELRVRKTGSLVYVIPEFMDKNSPLEEI